MNLFKLMSIRLSRLLWRRHVAGATAAMQSLCSVIRGQADDGARMCGGCRKGQPAPAPTSPWPHAAPQALKQVGKASLLPCASPRPGSSAASAPRCVHGPGMCCALGKPEPLVGQLTEPIPGVQHLPSPTFPSPLALSGSLVPHPTQT